MLLCGPRRLVSYKYIPLHQVVGYYILGSDRPKYDKVETFYFDMDFLPVFLPRGK